MNLCCFTYQVAIQIANNELSPNPDLHHPLCYKGVHQAKELQEISGCSNQAVHDEQKRQRKTDAEKC
ncbi:hypothetical protein AU255_12610 [Methyloprofundus sedimenti]|uniref:Uncharacterized protein n=1 Tax=Methyloprofundus sedimenti TaxID=1420851 RepID=A0A1V8MAJ0_9GAMM|nr:hypothetical protein AU255_12610 [Methyloprofundus sedimenti]